MKIVKMTSVAEIKEICLINKVISDMTKCEKHFSDYLRINYHV